MSIEDRLLALEQRLADLEGGTAGTTAQPRDTSAPHHSAAVTSEDPYWALNGLRDRLESEAGAVVWTGTVHTGAGPVAWQMSREAEELLEPEDTESLAASLAALGHPVRIDLALAVVRGTGKLSDLAAELGLASTGQLYHHVKALTAAGWLRPGSRGFVTVPPERVIPLLVILGASR
ncbi:ArsR/SmtB family transcription factor [Bogoriella caseilytica]|uniref:Helix-turn-helix protein n=1 Tax=Bogoriella caseilytica TaxID=56055 RepID=A0A3N2BD55_9MICO|nr:helix-turn-helix transcriptional regulator [Bogoriella caseilytica]ROR73179.1 hypothetical protein EDD31_1547 [Bogoriella caseilytica]